MNTSGWIIKQKSSCSMWSICFQYNQNSSPHIFACSKITMKKLNSEDIYLHWYYRNIILLLWHVVYNYTENTVFDVLKLISFFSGFPMVKVLIQLVHLKTCNIPGYNLLPLRELLHKYYQYPNEPWNSDKFFRELFTNYLSKCNIKNLNVQSKTHIINIQYLN